MSNKLAIAATLLATLVGAANAQQTTTGAATPVQGQVLNTLPANSTTVTNYYKQNVYDPSDTKIGEIADVLVGKDGKVEAFIVSVGGFLGIGEKDVAVPFSASHHERHEGFAQDSARLQVRQSQGDLGASIAPSAASQHDFMIVSNWNPCAARGGFFHAHCVIGSIFGQPSRGHSSRRNALRG
jgi:hypothetical protein